MIKKLPFSKSITYALGQLGWSLLAGIIGNYLIFYYIPTEKSGIIPVVSQKMFFGFLTIIGLITMAGRLFDAVTDPWIATLSDKSTSKMGRRISFLAKSALPFSVFTVLVFWNPTPHESIINIIFLTISLLLYYLFYTMYVTPYFALLSELGHTPNERLKLSTMISLTWFLGFALASQAAAIWSMLERMGHSKVDSMRITFTILAFIAFILLLIPVFTIDEKKYCMSVPSEMEMTDSIKATFRNKEFTKFVFSDLFYWVAITIFQSALIYYLTVLLDKKEALLGSLFIVLGVGSFIFYIPVYSVAKKIGKKKLLVIAFFMFVLTYLSAFFLGKYPIPNIWQAYILVAMASIPMAIFGILPNAVIADIAEYDALKTGVRREGMFFGTRTFMSKLGQMISMLVISTLLLIRYNGSQELGIRLTTISAAIFCLMGTIILFLYNEEKVMKVIEGGDDSV